MRLILSEDDSSGRSERNEIHLDIGKMTAVPPNRTTADSLFGGPHR